MDQGVSVVIETEGGRFLCVVVEIGARVRNDSRPRRDRPRNHPERGTASQLGRVIPYPLCKPTTPLT